MEEDHLPSTSSFIGPGQEAHFFALDLADSVNAHLNQSVDVWPHGLPSASASVAASTALQQSFDAAAASMQRGAVHPSDLRSLRDAFPQAAGSSLHTSVVALQAEEASQQAVNSSVRESMALAPSPPRGAHMFELRDSPPAAAHQHQQRPLNSTWDAAAAAASVVHAAISGLADAEPAGAFAEPGMASPTRHAGHGASNTTGMASELPGSPPMLASLRTRSPGGGLYLSGHSPGQVDQLRTSPLLASRSQSVASQSLPHADAQSYMQRCQVSGVGSARARMGGGRLSSLHPPCMSAATRGRHAHRACAPATPSRACSMRWRSATLTRNRTTRRQCTAPRIAALSVAVCAASRPLRRHMHAAMQRPGLHPVLQAVVCAWRHATPILPLVHPPCPAPPRRSRSRTWSSTTPS